MCLTRGICTAVTRVDTIPLRYSYRLNFCYNTRELNQILACSQNEIRRRLSVNRSGGFISRGSAISDTPAAVLIACVYCVNDGHEVNTFLVYSKIWFLIVGKGKSGRAPLTELADSLSTADYELQKCMLNREC